MTVDKRIQGETENIEASRGKVRNSAALAAMRSGKFIFTVIFLLMFVLLSAGHARAATYCRDNRSGTTGITQCGCSYHNISSCGGVCYVSSEFSYNYATNDLSWDYCQGHKMSYSITGYGNWVYIGMENGKAKYKRTNEAKVSCLYCSYVGSGTLTEYDYQNVHTHSLQAECVNQSQHMYYCANSTHTGTKNACGYTGYYENHVMSAWEWDGSRYVRHCKTTGCNFTEYETSLIYMNHSENCIPNEDSSSIQALSNSLYVNVLDRNEGPAYGKDCWVDPFFQGKSSADTMIWGVLFSQEASQKSWNDDNSEWIKRIYRALLHREPDASTSKFVSDLNSGTRTREEIYRVITRSNEFRNYWGICYSNNYESSSPKNVSCLTHFGGYASFGSYGGGKNDWSRPEGYALNDNYWHLQGSGHYFGDSSITVSFSENKKVYLEWQKQCLTINLYRNNDSSDTVSVTEKFEYGSTFGRLGYYSNGAARYSPMAAATEGFGSWVRAGYYLPRKPWSTSENGEGYYETYSNISDEMITKYCGTDINATLNLYLLWSANPPEISVRYNKKSGGAYTPGYWTSEDVVVTAVVNDGGSGHPENYISWDGGSTFGSSASLYLSSTGKYSGSVMTVNNAKLTAGTEWGRVLIDKQSPVLIDRTSGYKEYSSDGSKEYTWQNVSKHLSFSAYDEHSGINTLVIRDSGGKVLACGTGSITYDVSAEGENFYTVTATDKVGNSTSLYITVRLDMTAPVYTAEAIYEGEKLPDSGEKSLTSIIAINRTEYRKFTIKIAAAETVNGIKNSGLGSFYAVIGNLDSLESRRYDAELVRGAMSSELTIDIDSDDRFFMGELGIYVFIKDVAGNVTELNDGLGVFTLEAEAVSRFSEDTEIFPRGSTGLLKLQVSGYASRVDVLLPEDICHESYAGEFSQGAQSEATSFNLADKDFDDGGKAKRELEFYIPLYYSGGDFVITVTAIKADNKIVYNPLLNRLEGTSELTVNVPVHVEGSVLDDIYTSLR